MWQVAILSLATVGAVDVDVRTLDQRSVSGSLTELSAERIVVTHQGKSVSIPAAELLSLMPRRGAETASAAKSSPSESGLWVELIDGSRLLARELSLDGAHATLSLGTQTVRLSTATIRSVELQSVTDPVAKRWAELRAAKATADRLVVRRSEQTIDSMEGTVRKLTPDTLHFELDGDVAKVRRTKVFGFLLYRPGDRRVDDVVAYVDEVTKTRWAASRLQLEKDGLRLVTSAGLEVVRPWSSIVRLDFSAGKIQYLSDLEPEAVTWTPLVASAALTPEFESFFRPRRDRALRGGSLQLAKSENGRRTIQSFDKGLALHSRTRLVYRLPSSFRTFTAVAGIDARMKGAGGVRLEILADEKRLFDRTIRGADEPVPLSFDVQGAGRLTIVVDFGDDGDVADHLDLCDARLAR
ncbi:MAG: NPCBM/NEW2 domain-containing protein [Pirellulales bacterium]